MNEKSKNVMSALSGRKRIGLKPDKKGIKPMDLIKKLVIKREERNKDKDTEDIDKEIKQS